ncbi:acetyl-CoA C-acyltransferase [Sandaracinobacter sp. RS1-74]|uniref:acetyl-CoA C-acyltransferase n=1 Tax=Sandaracinobacteroides sayramensis TaxID=2913411 RepID=UPI001EDC1876|nr:acetyl-CoA C-acyltransferase [Sandaracinobacteroides sayramensis]MCG2840488.1 acetyl-CoA C-acyltransferase [Sandaracinobacteroides sayramensis]
MSASSDIVVVSARRTAMGGFQGDFRDVTAPDLGAAALKAAVADAGLGATDVEQVVMGCVLPAGLGQAPARQAALKAGLDLGTACVTLNKMCGSGMKAVMDAHDALKAGSAGIVAAGGMESMTNAPYLLPKARGGYRMGHGRVMDHMFLDGLEDAYEPGRAMGTFAEETARAYQFTREAQDAFALESLARSQRAIADGSFVKEITAVATKAGDVLIDEQPGKARPEKIPHLKPAFAADGTVTAANSSSISDGGAALVLMRRETAEARGLSPIATILGHSVHAQKPALFTTAPVPAIGKLVERLGWTVEGIDLFEVNEAFAVVTMVAMRELGIPHDRVNVNGGATALGHPIGASGARILVTLIHALQKRGGGTGVASLCIGGGEATAVALQVH